MEVDENLQFVLSHLDDPHWRSHFMKLWIPRAYVNGGGHAVQMVHTPEKLCQEIVGKLLEFADIKDKTILVLNVEFLPFLLGKTKEI